MSEQQAQRIRHSTPKRWQAALSRALAEGVTVRQVNANGMWVASSGSDRTMAYLLEIMGGVVHSCTCPAGQHGDPVCKHRAQWYYDVGLLDFQDDSPEPPPAAPTFSCPRAPRVRVGDGLRRSDIDRLGSPCPLWAVQGATHLSPQRGCLQPAA
jgi:hypothetical protein